MHHQMRILLVQDLKDPPLARVISSTRNQDHLHTPLLAFSPLVMRTSPQRDVVLRKSNAAPIAG